ncbi:unnamed protein product [Miscanthus lutarioriparius]|uniref:CRAL-TRIO domain-containing protein n=1 Tax=Miscanthus lutarioriparius TaxID=422564 RepID=A0A811SIW0_9POAL|nr:unnamed protein product [Miscanthus lutarioriparius]
MLFSVGAQPTQKEEIWGDPAQQEQQLCSPQSPVPNQSPSRLATRCWPEPRRQTRRVPEPLQTPLPALAEPLQPATTLLHRSRAALLQITVRPRPRPIPRRRQGSREVNGKGVELPAASAALALQALWRSRSPPGSLHPSVRCVVGSGQAQAAVFAVGRALHVPTPTLVRDQQSQHPREKGREDDDCLLLLLPLRRPSSSAQVQERSALPKRRPARCQRCQELSEESVKGLYQTGKAYVHDSLDVYGRPVLVVVAAKHFPSTQDPVENQKLCAYLVEKAVSRLPSGAETILGIFDLRGFRVENGDLQFLKFLIDVFYYYYPKRLGQVLFVDAPFVFQPMWQVVKPLLKYYASLVRFCDAETVRKEYFKEETVPLDFCN